jgi:virulence factor Mce-like protein
VTDGRRPIAGQAVRAVSSNPAFVGAVTVLIIVVAVFLAYNANNGLPFVPTYQLTAQVPNANALVKGNDVRIGNVLVGRVLSVEPARLGHGRFGSRVELSLNENIKPLPVNSTVAVRSRSLLGLKYLGIEPGNAKKGFPDGATIPLTAAKPRPVELDQLLNTFNARTRAAIQRNLTEFGTALGGRGAQLNAAIGALRPLVEHLAPAAANLASRRTDISGFFSSLAATASELAPVADTQASLFVALDRTFAAFASVAPSLEQTIARSPRALDAANRSFPVVRPFLSDSKEFFAKLAPGARSLERHAPAIAGALEAGTPTLNASPALSRQLTPTAQALVDFQRAPGVNRGLGILIQTNHILDPTLRFVTPAQTTCNYVSLLFQNVASTGSNGDGLGTWQRFITFTPPSGPNSEGSPASAPASGPEKADHLHYNPYPNTASPGQPRECEAGNEHYIAGRTVIGNDPGTQSLITAGQLPSQLHPGGKR